MFTTLEYFDLDFDFTAYPVFAMIMHLEQLSVFDPELLLVEYHNITFMWLKNFQFHLPRQQVSIKFMLWLFIQHQTSTTATFWILKLDTLALDTKARNALRLYVVSLLRSRQACTLNHKGFKKLE